jgi:hypothetical protein
MTRKILGCAQIGERATITFFQEEDSDWNYPQIDLEGHEGEGASINLQHMPIDLIHKLADEIKRIAFLLESNESKKGNNNKTLIL